ncbi:MAG: hypothetical protein IKH26_07045 [Bacteroidaceae bacterium]|nr:hypothetical protein [Bacteroidaceae bacterium]
MPVIQVKSFITHKRGETDTDVQDSIAFDMERGRYALSDGVTNSYLPKIISDLLTRTFIEAEEEADFPPAALPHLFKMERDSYLDNVEEKVLVMLKMVEKTFHVGAATFAGLTVNGDELKWIILGDSCLFLMPEDGRLRCFSSMPVNVSPEWLLDVNFDNHPSQIHSDGKVIGEWIKGRRVMSHGWAVLASDAMSKWIINQYNKGRDFISELWTLDDNEEFEAFVNQEYLADRLESDDESVILICIGNNENSEINAISEKSEEDEISESSTKDENAEDNENPDLSEISEQSKSEELSQLSDDLEEHNYYDDFDYSDYAQ